jgi:hypothetical protein
MEDAVSEAVIRRALNENGQVYASATIYNRGGNGYLKRTIRGFNNAAKGTPFLVLTDLDKYECPATLIDDWLEVSRHPNLLLRVAVVEIEAWLLADRTGIAEFLGVSPNLVPENIDTLADPKATLVNLACKSRKRDIKRDICPGSNSTRKVGPNYNAQLVGFVQSNWDLRQARTKSESLNRLLIRLANFEPAYG